MHDLAWKIVKWMVGFLSLYLDWRLRTVRTRRPMDVWLLDMMMRGVLRRPNFKPFDAAGRRVYRASIARTVLWHGTGRYQYDSQGKQIDVLEGLLKQGGMRPATDIFDVKHGAMLSISLARQRMYARIYADMHVHKGARAGERYGSARFWAYYFIMAINVHATMELKLWNPTERRRQLSAWRTQASEVWAVKVTKHPGKSTGTFFNNGSDIAGNYPVLIGITDGDYTVLQTADYITRYERRIGSVIPVAAFTHIEVPAGKLAEVRTICKKYGLDDLPIFAFGQCEQLHAQLPFSALVAQPRQRS